MKTLTAEEHAQIWRAEELYWHANAVEAELVEIREENERMEVLCGSIAARYERFAKPKESVEQ